jgi:hypothetical protein
MARLRPSNPNTFTTVEVEGRVANLPKSQRKYAVPTRIKFDSTLRRVHRRFLKQFNPHLAVKLSNRIGNRRKVGNENLVGAGLSEKRVNGRYTGQPCIKFHVSRKMHRSLIEDDCLIPSEIEGIVTDVESCGAVFALNGLPPKRLQPGEIIKNVRGDPAGTLACLVTNGTDLCLLSNNHVLALLNQGTIRNLNAYPPQQGDIIDYVLAFNDGSTQDYSIGYLLNYVTLNLNQGVNLVDCAIALVDCHWVEPDIYSLGNIEPRPVAPYHGQPVQKFGFTGFTTGMVDALDYTADVAYPTGDTARFVQQFTVNGTNGAFAAAGDSGSLVVEQGSNRPVGMVLGGAITGGPAFAVVTPIDIVLRTLQVTMATTLPTFCYQ